MKIKNKYLSGIFSIVVFFISNLAFGFPITMSGPTPAIPAEIASGSVSTYTYRISNQAPQTLPSLLISGISAPVSRVSVPGDCGNNVPVSGCNIGIQITPQASDIGKTINQTMVVRASARKGQEVTSPIQFKVTTGAPVLTSISIEPMTAALPAGLTAPLKAIGHYSNDSTQDITNQVNWLSSDSNVANISSGGLATGVEVGEAFITASLDAISSQSTPFLVTQPLWMATIGKSSASNQSLILVSQNNGNNWSQRNMTNMHNPSMRSITDFTAQDMSCVRPDEEIGLNGSVACVAVGSNSDNAAQIVMSGSDLGTWQLAGQIHESGSFKSISCSYRPKSTLCAAVGYNGENQPIIYTNDDLVPNRWLPRSYNGGVGNKKMASSGITGALVTDELKTGFNSVSCSIMKNSGHRCVAVGEIIDPTKSTPLISVTQDSGLTWSTKTIENFTEGSINAVSCAHLIDNPDNNICVAVGRDNVMNTPVILVSRDGGDSWQFSTSIPRFSTLTKLTSVSCSADYTKYTCAIAGFVANENNLPLIVVADSQFNWSLANLDNPPNIDTGTVKISCASGVCAASGRSLDDSLPLFLAVSTPGNLNSWTLKSVPNIPATNISGIECVSAGSAKPVCTAVGFTTDRNFPRRPILLKSLNAGVDWSVPETDLPPAYSGSLDALGSTQLTPKS